MKKQPTHALPEQTPALPIQRRKFIQYLALGGLSVYLDACTSKPTPAATDAAKEVPPPTPPPTHERLSLTSNDHVTYVPKDPPEYDNLRAGHNKRISKFPAVIAVCHSVEGVQQAMKYAKQENLPVAVKSGGHSLEGYSCNDGGMVINLSEFKGVEFLDEETVKLGPACTLSELYSNLLPKGRLLPGGSCGSVAVGGLTLGGGYGMYARKYGLTCDHLLEFKMVDGNGNLVSSKDDPDLLRACKGGGSGNFGVLTEMVFKTHPAPQTLTSHRFRKFKTDAATAANLLEQWFEITASLPPACFSVFVLNGKTVFILLTNFEKETPDVAAAIQRLSAMTEKVTLGSAKPLADAVKTFFGQKEPVYYKNSSVGLYKNYEDLRPFAPEALASISATPGMIFSIGTLGGKIDDPDFEKNSVFPHRSSHYLSELQMYWDKESQGASRIADYQIVRDIFLGNGMTKAYFNYPDVEFKNWETAYYGDNYAFLQGVKKKYDPSNVLRYEQSVRSS